MRRATRTLRRARTALISKATVLVLCLLSVSCALRSSVGRDIEEVRAVELNLRDALSNGAPDVLEAYLADDYVHTNHRGAVRTKRVIIDDLEAEFVTREYLGLDDIRIRVFADVAVVTARTSARRNVRGVETTGDYRQMRIFRREAGRWRAILMQTTLIAE